MVVGIADMKMAQYEGMLVTYALGSCIGICLYDPGLRLAALVHDIGFDIWRRRRKEL